MCVCVYMCVCVGGWVGLGWCESVKEGKFGTKVFFTIMMFNEALKSCKKSHTCEEGGAPLTISFWHLLMNLKNK